MPQLSPNIRLPLYDRTADKPELFIDYRDDVNGTGSTSGFSIIDDKFGEVDTTLDTLKGIGWTDESIMENSLAIAALKEKGVYTALVAGTNTLTATITDFAGTPPANSTIMLVPNSLNTTTVTLSINSETAKPVNKARGKTGTVIYDVLEAKDLRPNVPILIRKSNDGARYILVGYGESFAKDVFYDNGDTTFTSVQDKITTHISDVVFTEDGVHGIRYFNEKLEYFDGVEWVEIQTGGGGSIPIGNVTDFEAQSGNEQVTLLWTDPNDIIVEGATLAAWGGTKIVRKIGSYPTDENDGTLVVNSTNRNQYSVSGYVDTLLVNETQYYYMAFPYTIENLVTINELNRVTATPTATTFDYLYAIDNFVATNGNTTVSLSWDNPVDASFDGVMIRRKTSEYPTSISDGTLVYNGNLETYSDTGLTKGVTYYYRAFAYSTSGGVTSYNITTYTQQASATPIATQIYGIRIDQNNTNPETSVIYTDDAVGFTGGSSAWDSTPIFQNIKPCMLLNGVVNYYLNPNNYAQKSDLSPSNITTGVDGDVMVEIPKLAYMIYTEGQYVYVKVTDSPNAKSIDNRFVYFGHTRTTEGDKDKLYIGAYLGWYDGTSKLRSLSGKTPTATQTIGMFRTQAQANGEGYSQVGFYPLTLLQCLYTIRYKNLDSQTALGRGYVGGNSSAIATGGTNAKTMYFGETTGKQQMKFLGVEDFWGNVRWWIDGLFSNATWNILTAFTSFNDTGSGYTNRGQGATANISEYMGKIQGSSQTGYIIKEVGTGSATTNYCDFAILTSSRLPLFGGHWGDVSSAGAFQLRVNYYAADSDSTFGSRLMFL